MMRVCANSVRTIINMETARNSEVTSDRFSVIGICNSGNNVWIIIAC
jgi:hypothetical protein